ncbi:putative T7SS-secreted protein [Streptomyces purpurascens]|uniref:Integral membrane protein n=1 Tax=Streptomyces purpurascens TaxID=1924 RepID=A0ABZ1MR19_STREF|nr:hypothetical protein [Streptomyces purpurascens]MCE7045686.1 hypothetical protein [Streptomyces purpurascens]GHA08300.1 hypothetical protein GCM10010303_17710 [Streptomyces purpurascens]
MTYTPGIEQRGAARDPQTLADIDKPQGLKSAPRIANPDYPHLGFNPAPGSTDTVRDLYGKLASCAKVLEETHDLVTKLMDGSHWKGDAAVAFREELDGGPLPLNLKNAAHSIRKAARQLDRWEGELDDFQRRAKRLESDAKDAQADLDAAKGRAEKAKDDQSGKGARHNDARHNDARDNPTHVNSAIDEAQAELDKTMSKAKRLAEEHEEKARYRAGKIRDATKKLAPREPGWLDEALDWLDENLADVLSWTAAAIGIAALFVATGGTAAVVLLLVGATLSAEAMAKRLSDPEVRASLWDGVRHGELDADFWSNAVGVAADGLGALPGVGAVAKGAPSLLRGVGEAGEVLTLGQRLAGAGGKTMAAAKEFADVKNPFTDWVVGKAPQLTRTVEVGEKTAPWAGMATASYGLATKMHDSLESDTGEVIGTSVDGAFLGPVDVAETVDLARRVFR